MRFRLLRRRLTISAPRMAVRSALPWPFRWLLIAVVFGFSGAVALWAFEFGKTIAGLEPNAKEELAHLRSENAQLRQERDQAQSIANTANSLRTAEQASQEKLAAQLRQLQLDNQSLRDDLGFFEKLLPAGGADGVAIRGLQADMLPGAPQLKWQVLGIQAVKNAPEFNGQLELSLSGLVSGKPWSMTLPLQALQLRQYRRLEGLVDLPPQAVVKTVSAKLIQGNATRALQTYA